MKSESEVAQSCPTLSDPMNCSLPGSSVHGIFQARVLEWVAIAFSTWRAYWSIYLQSGSCGSAGKESTCNVGDLGLLPGLGRTPGEGNGNPLQYSCLENPRQRSLAGCSPCDHKEWDTENKRVVTKGERKENLAVCMAWCVENRLALGLPWGLGRLAHPLLSCGCEKKSREVCSLQQEGAVSRDDAIPRTTSCCIF